MGVKNRNTKRERPVREKWVRAAVFTVVFTGVVFAVLQYYKFVSKTVYEESVSHLTEVFHQSDNMLREVTNQNLTYLHMWAENLQNLSDEREIRDYIEKAQEDAGFLDFYFLSADGNYKMVTGQTGYLGLQEKWKKRSGREMIL
jgi:two-component system sensor histidine kinase/response regulator